MKTILDRLFKEAGFESWSEAGDLVGYSRKDADFHEYYFVHFIDAVFLDKYLDGKYKDFLDYFKKEKAHAEDVSKNSSLIVCVKHPEFLPSKLDDRKKIIEIEEDQFTARKYVLNYNEAGIERLKEQSPILEFLRETAKEEARFEGFSKSAVGDPEFYVVMQLFAKLPFLLLGEAGGTEVRGVEDFISKELNKGSGAFDRILSMLELGNEENEGKLKLFDGKGIDLEFETAILQAALDLEADKDFDDLIERLL